jgi:hypothetical protein
LKRKSPSGDLCFCANNFNCRRRLRKPADYFISSFILIANTI